MVLRDEGAGQLVSLDISKLGLDRASRFEAIFGLLTELG